MAQRVLVLGGYGTFGGRISHALAKDSGLQVIVGGRNKAHAQRWVDELQKTIPHCDAQALAIDITSPYLAECLRESGARIVVHTCGPFQQQDYRVAKACIAAGVHYIDLGDGREFVCNITALDEQARSQDVLVVSGASSVPGLSAAVVDKFLPEFSRLASIDCGINPGNKTPRGLATVWSILSYCGRPFQRLEQGRWKTVYGWQNLHRQCYPADVGYRWLGSCDIPDLELFPKRYPDVQTVMFSAGLELSILHLATWAASWLTRLRLVDNWTTHAALLKRISELFEKRGSTRGGMHVTLTGLDHADKPLKLSWYIIADSGDGPQIPCVSAILLAKKLARGEIAARGAQACLSLFTLDEFMAELAGFDIQEHIETTQ